MLRPSVAILALLILPGFLSSQETRPRQERTHEVVKGETLWALAGRYLGNPFRWPLIAEANRGIVADPDLIFPGQVLVIPNFDAEPARVEGVSVLPPGGVQPPPQQAQPQPPAGQVQPTGPVAPPCPGPQNRTIFYRGQGGERGCTMVLPGPEERTAFYRAGEMGEAETATAAPAAGGIATGEVPPRPWVPQGLVYAADWVEAWGSEPESVASVDGFSGDVVGQPATDRAVFLEHLRILPTPGVNLRVGELLQSYEVSRRDENLGVVCSPTGILVVTSVGEGGVMARVSAVYDRIRVGDFLKPVPDYVPRPGARPVAVQSNVTAEVVGFSEDRPIQGFMAGVFLSVGRPQGIEPGDEFAVFANEPEDLPSPEIARLRVLLVGETTSTARIVSLTEPDLEVGNRVVLVKKIQ